MPLFKSDKAEIEALRQQVARCPTCRRQADLERRRGLREQRELEDRKHREQRVAEAQRRAKAGPRVTVSLGEHASGFSSFAHPVDGRSQRLELARYGTPETMMLRSTWEAWRAFDDVAAALEEGVLVVRDLPVAEATELELRGV